MDKYKQFFDAFWKKYFEVCSEDLHELMEDAIKLELVKEVPYSPSIHGLIPDVEAGDSIYIKPDQDDEEVEK